MKELANQIATWLGNYARNANRQSLVVGVSGGVDSGLVSTLCAMTGLKTVVVTLPCQSRKDGLTNADLHIEWLKANFPNVESVNIDLTPTFETFAENLPEALANSGLAYANAKSRLRMIALYQVATVYSGLVVGTGNRVEDFGVGFFTKYGDGGVDISPISDLTKTEVRQMAAQLGVNPAVAMAIPTDGLWDDGRTDEGQLGARYEEFELVMDYLAGKLPNYTLSARDQEVLAIYLRWHNLTAHKMAPIPSFKRA